MARERARYEKLLAGLRLRNFAPGEVTSYAEAVRGGVRNELPPEELWENIIPTLWVVDHLRGALGRPIVLTSIYRSEAYNRQVGGKPQSFHRRNQAIDFQVKGVSPRVAYNRLLKMRQAGVFRGGLGLYKTFVHVDTRGRNANWTG